MSNVFVYDTIYRILNSGVCSMNNVLTDFLKNSLTPFHVTANAAEMLEEGGFVRLYETTDWSLCEGGKYYLIRGGSLIAFTVGSLDDFSYKIVASHTDSSALKLKENPIRKTENYATLNVEKYGTGIWYSFFDRPLKIAGRVVRRIGGMLKEETVTSPFLVTIPSLAIHQNREVNDKFAVNPQVDLQPLCALLNEECSAEDVLHSIVGEHALAYDLFLVNADLPYTFGANNEFLASPRIDNLTSVCATLEALFAHAESNGVCVAALLNNEEVGSVSTEGADSDFLENTLRRIAYALRFDDNEYYKALAGSFMLSADNAHAVHPNHPEKSDPTNRCLLGNGIVIKTHAGKAYTTDAVCSAIAKTVFDNAEIKHQSFYNRSDMKSGGTLGVLSQRHLGVLCADIGIAQLAMHSACECIAIEDYDALKKGLAAFFASTIHFNGETVTVE